MWQLILGTAGFVLYFVYDINSVLSKNVCLQKFFAWGSILVVASVVAEFCSAWGQGHRSVEAVIGFGIGALFFLGLLIYTLFFALPSSGCIVVCRGLFMHVGNAGRMETGNLFWTYDFLELSVYHFSGSVDISTDIF